MASLTGLPLEALKQGTSVAEAAAELEEEQERERIHGEVVAKTVDLFRRRPLHWLEAEGSFPLSLGDHGWILLSPDGGLNGEK